MLLQFTCDPSHSWIQDQDTPLHYAVLSCCFQSVQLLVDNKAAVNACNKVAAKAGRL